MKAEIQITFSYGGNSIGFIKIFTFAFAPFYGLDIKEYVSEDYWLETRIKNDHYTTSNITFDISLDIFHVNIREHWHKPVTDECIDSTIEDYAKCGWTRIDRTDVDALKALMLSDYEKERKNSHGWERTA